MAWSNEGAMQGMATGSLGFATGNPLVGAATTVGGAIVGGLLGGGSQDPVQPSPAYQAPYGTGFVGGTNTNYITQSTDQMSDEELYYYLLDNADSLNLTPEQQDVLFGRGDYASGSGGYQSPPNPSDVLSFLPDMSDHVYTEAQMPGSPSSYQRDRFDDPNVQALLGWAQNNIPEVNVGSYETPWAQDQGRSDVATGTDIVQQGLAMGDRAATGRDDSWVDQSRGQAGDSRTGFLGASNQAGQDQATMAGLLGGSLNQQQAQLAAGQGLLANQYGQGADQLAYMQAVQRGEAGPSLAETMSNRVLGEQVNNQMAMAKSGSSFNPGAQRQASIAGTQMADTQRQQLAERRAQEQMNAQNQVGSLLGLQQQGAMLGANYGLQGANQIGQFGMGGAGQLAGLTQAQQQAWLAQQQADANRMGNEMNWANTGAALTEQQKMRDDAMRQYLASLGMDWRGQGYGVLANQAGNEVALAGINSGATNAANNLAFNTDVYNQNRADEASARNWQAAGTIVGGVANSGVLTPSPEPEQAPPPTSYAASQNPGGWNQSEQPAPSDARTKQDLADANRQIDQLLAALANQSSERQLAVAGGDHSVGRMPDVQPTLGGMAEQKPQQWRYTEQAQRQMPGAGPGQRVGYTTDQLKQAGPAGRTMVETDPQTGYEQLNPQATDTFTLAAIGEQERKIRELEERLAQAEKSGGSRGVLGAAGGY